MCSKDALLVMTLEKFCISLVMKVYKATGTSAMVLFRLAVAAYGLKIVRSKHPLKAVERCSKV